jgi:hypothetical protein
LRGITKDKSIAEIGVLSAKQKFLGKNHRIQLKISTYNLSKPNFILDFLVGGTTSQKRKIMQEVYDWATRIETL